MSQAVPVELGSGVITPVYNNDNSRLPVKQALLRRSHLRFGDKPSKWITSRWPRLAGYLPISAVVSEMAIYQLLFGTS